MTRLRIALAIVTVASVAAGGGALGGAKGPRADDGPPPGAPATLPATLDGLAVLPALTFVEPPPDVPASCRSAGKYVGGEGRRVEMDVAARANGVTLPFADGQPVQGFSGVEPLGDGTFLALSDNGFGSRVDSPDALLAVHRVEPDWQGGRLHVRATTFLTDPDRVIPFRIVNEATRERYLTGADLDPESLRRIGDTLWIGDELGPYLVRADPSGRITGLFETRVSGRRLRSPDHYAVTTPAAPGPVEFEVRRSRGFEALGASPDGRRLYAALEAPLAGETDTLVLEFDVATTEFTGRTWRLSLEEDRALSDLTMVDASRAIVLERDEAEGEAAQVKRLCTIILADGAVARRLACVDLLDGADPGGHAGPRGEGGRYRMPFVTIEGVAVLDGEHVVVVNDNNLPFSAGRTPGRPDDTELARLRVPELLRAR